MGIYIYRMIQSENNNISEKEDINDLELEENVKIDIKDVSNNKPIVKLSSKPITLENTKINIKNMKKNKKKLTLMKEIANCHGIEEIK